MYLTNHLANNKFQNIFKKFKSKILSIEKMAQVSYPHQSSPSSQHKQQRITQLPGENGFHARDGSLIRKKQEQWEREKGEIFLNLKLFN